MRSCKSSGRCWSMKCWLSVLAARLSYLMLILWSTVFELVQHMSSSVPASCYQHSHTFVNQLIQTITLCSWLHWWCWYKWRDIWWWRMLGFGISFFELTFMRKPKNSSPFIFSCLVILHHNISAFSGQQLSSLMNNCSVNQSVRNRWWNYGIFDKKNNYFNLI